MDTCTIYLILYTFSSVIYQTHGGKGNNYSSINAPKSIIHKLRSDLLKNYDKGARPFNKGKNVTEVKFSFYPSYILDLDEENHILSLEAWMSMQWMDKNLAWNPRNYTGLYAIQLSPYEIWKPDIIIHSSKPVDSYNPLNMDTDILSFSNGQQFWVPPASISTYCEMDYSYYPLDVQECKVVFGSWSHHGGVLDIELWEDQVYMNEFHNTNHMWEVTSTTMKKVVDYYQCCQEHDVTVEAKIYLRRKHSSIPNRRLKGPSLLAVLLTLLMFWLPPSSYTKIIFGCVSLIVLSICLFYIGKATRSSIVTIITANTVNSLLYIMATALLVEIAVVSMTRIGGLCRPPAILTSALCNRITKYMFIKLPEKEFGLMDSMDTNSDEGSLMCSRDSADDWFVLSTAMDRIFFFIFSLAFIAHFSIFGL